MATSNLNDSVRVVIAVVFAITLSLFILLWDGHFFPFPIQFIQEIGGFFLVLPFISYVTSLATNSLVQYLSCQKVDIVPQLTRSLIVPACLFTLGGVLWFVPGLRWPIEGLVPSISRDTKTGLSSAFYVFWIALYGQTFSNSLSQAC